MELEPPKNVDQSHAKAGGDNVAGDKTTIGQIIVNTPQRKKSKIEMLIAKLELEIQTNQQVRTTIQDLQYYHTRVSEDGIDGLEGKLKHSGREDMIATAWRQKEAFAKKLEQYSHYASAQEIFAFLLSKVEYLFRQEIRPMLAQSSVDQVNKATGEKIVQPIIEEICDDIMGMNYNHVEGMLYWLAEQCFVRWHV